VFGCDIHRAWEPPIALRRPGRDLRLAVVTWPQMAATDPSSGHMSGHVPSLGSARGSAGEPADRLPIPVPIDARQMSARLIRGRVGTDECGHLSWFRLVRLASSVLVPPSWWWWSGDGVSSPGLAPPILGTGTKNAADLGQLTSGWLVPYAVAGYRCLGGARRASGAVIRSAPRSPSTTWRATSDSRLLRLRA
jgi:hypothetical protein